MKGGKGKAKEWLDGSTSGTIGRIEPGPCQEKKKSNKWDDWKSITRIFSAGCCFSSREKIDSGTEKRIGAPAP